jgi:hypothetical protein
VEKAPDHRFVLKQKSERGRHRPLEEVYQFFAGPVGMPAEGELDSFRVGEVIDGERNVRARRVCNKQPGLSFAKSPRGNFCQFKSGIDFDFCAVQFAVAFENIQEFA